MHMNNMCVALLKQIGLLRDLTREEKVLLFNFHHNYEIALVITSSPQVPNGLLLLRLVHWSYKDLPAQNSNLPKQVSVDSVI